MHYRGTALFESPGGRYYVADLQSKANWTRDTTTGLDLIGIRGVGVIEQFYSPTARAQHDTSPLGCIPRFHGREL
jgi:hypothetical protein